mmetsp:Transcript_33917/g.55819  ORF Transcript_33917/g.55819 Transcript_33917/m.55819 type:complete len:104 (+) Transcript_33917:2-313(+)
MRILIASALLGATLGVDKKSAMCTESGAQCVQFIAFGSRYNGCTTDYSATPPSQPFPWCATDSKRALFNDVLTGDWSRCKRCTQAEADKQGNHNLKISARQEL